MVIAIDEVECAVYGTANVIVLENILSRNWRMCRYSGRTELMVSMDDTPLTIGFLDTKGRCRMWRLTLTYHTRRELRTKELVYDVTLFLG